MRRLLLVALASTSMLACHARAQTDPTPPPADYEVHEWGVLRFIGAQGELSTSMLTPPRVHWDMPTVDKPVIYFHADERWDPATTIDVSVAIPGGRLREVWPMSLGVPLTDTYTWQGLTISAGCAMDVVPTQAMFPCTNLTDGGVCETAEMREYMQPPDRCVVVDGQVSPALLYNGYTPAARPAVYDPVRYELTNTSDAPIGPVWLPAPGGVVADEIDTLAVDQPAQPYQRVRVDQVAPGATVTTLGITPMDYETFVADLQDTLVARGLTRQEAGDLYRAWQTTILAEWQAPVPLGFYDQATVEATYPLTFTPAPTAIHRVMLFTLE